MTPFTTMVRGATALLLLSLSLFAQTYTVRFAGAEATAEAPAYVKLVDGLGAWRGSAFIEPGEVVISNGALEAYHATLSGPLEVLRDGELIIDTVVTVHDGCGFVVRDEAIGWTPPDRRAALWLSWYHGGGPEHPDLDVCREWDWGGPDPDPSDAGATGSGRVAWSRWPLGIAMQHLMQAGEDPSAAQWAEAYRWGARAPWDRAQHYHHAEPGVCCWTPTELEPEGPAGRRFRASFHPDAVIGWGYRDAGGFSDLYGRTEWFGRVGADGKPVRSKGKHWVDRQHADQAGTVWVAAATGSWAARRAMLDFVETLASENMAADYTFPNSRAFGWPVRSFALVFKLTGDEDLLPYIDAIDEALVESRGLVKSKRGPRFYMTLHKPLGGHLDTSEAFDEFLDAIGYEGSRSELLKWDSAWMASILGLSCLFMVDAVADTGLKPGMAGGLIPGESRAASWRAHARWAAAFVFDTSTDIGFNVETMEHTLPGWPDLRLSNARSPITNVWSNTKKGSGSGENNWVFGVGAGTVLPFAEDFARRFPGHAAAVLPLADAIAARCYDASWWDGKTPDRFLLDRAHVWAGRVGWKPKGWKPPAVPVVQPEDN